MKETVFVCAAFLFLGFCIGAVMGSNATKYTPPCGYGATPRIVIEQDGEPRKVCGCSGGIEGNAK